MNYRITSSASVHLNKVMVDGQIDYFQENFVNFADFIRSLYKKEGLVYPKFFKMDSLSKLGFITAELALKGGAIGHHDLKRIGVVVANSASSLDTDLDYQETIRDRSNYFPSPSVFVYTLPNILIGEICIRHKIKGENAFLISERFDPKLLADYVTGLLSENRIDACLTGWVELHRDRFESLLVFVERDPDGSGRPFTAEKLNMLYRNI